MYNKTKTPQTSTPPSHNKGGHASSQSKAPNGSSEEPKPGSASNARSDGPRRRLPGRSMLSTQLEFEGNLKFTGTTTVDCVFRGNIDTEDTLIVGASAKIEAEIHAGVVEISGTVIGNIWAKNTVKIASGSEVTGDIETPTISMEEGVSFAGRCTRPPKQGRQDFKAKKPVEPKEEPRRELEPVGVSSRTSVTSDSVSHRSAEKDHPEPDSTRPE